MKTFKEDYPYIFDEYNKANFNKDSGLEVDKLKELVDEYFETHKDTPIEIQRAESLSILFLNCQIEVNPHTPFADKFNLGINYSGWAGEPFYQQDYRKRIFGAYDKYCHDAWYDRYLLDKIGLGAPDNDLWHTTPDWKNVIDLGIPGLKKRAEEYLQNATDENRAFYQSVVMVYDMTLKYMHRLELEAKRVGNEVFEKCMHELQLHAPETLYQAMELSLLYMQIEEIGMERCRTLGNLNLVYRKVLEKSREYMSNDEIRELLRYFLAKINAGKRYANQPLCIGGYDKDGNTTADDFSLFLLQEYRELKISNPKIHVRYNDKLREDIYEEVIECIRKGSSSIVIISDEVIMEGYKKIGIQEDESRLFLPLGCYENVIPHVEDGRICSCWINLVKPVEWAITGGLEISKNESPFEYEKLDNSTWEKFYQNYLYYLNKITNRVKNSVNEQERVGKMVYASPFLSGTLTPCMENGKDLFQNGMKYNNSSMKYCCTASAVDSLLAIKHFVYETKEVTLKELEKILESNWEANPLLRAKIINHAAKFGSGNEEAGKLAKNIFDYISEIILNKPNGWGGVYRVGSDSVENSDRFGLRNVASADGRLANTPFSKNMRPVNGMEREGITGYMRNMLAINQYNLIDAAPLDFLLHPSAVKGMKGFLYFKELIRYYLTHGGNTIMGNVVDYETLVDAQKHPENYQNLQIRVCGWNEYFVQMSTLVQNEFIMRAKGVE